MSARRTLRTLVLLGVALLVSGCAHTNKHAWLQNKPTAPGGGLIKQPTYTWPVGG